MKKELIDVLRLSKGIHKKLSKDGHPTLKLSEVQQAVSKSLGAKNLHEIETIKKTTYHDEKLKDFDQEKFNQLFLDSSLYKELKDKILDPFIILTSFTLNSFCRKLDFDLSILLEEDGVNFEYKADNIDESDYKNLFLSYLYKMKSGENYSSLSEINDEIKRYYFKSENYDTFILDNNEIIIDNNNLNFVFHYLFLSFNYIFENPEQGYDENFIYDEKFIYQIFSSELKNLDMTLKSSYSFKLIESYILIENAFKQHDFSFPTLRFIFNKLEKRDRAIFEGMKNSKIAVSEYNSVLSSCFYQHCYDKCFYLSLIFLYHYFSICIYYLLDDKHYFSLDDFLSNRVSYLFKKQEQCTLKSFILNHNFKTNLIKFEKDIDFEQIVHLFKQIAQ